MAEEERLTGGGDGDERVSEWELGLPNIADLTPLSQSLISSEMLSAFSISPEPYRNMSDVNRASQNTLSDIRGNNLNSINNNNNSISNNNNKGNESVVDLTESRKLRKVSYDGDGDGDGSGGAVEEIDNESDMVTDKAETAAASKRQRLVWTPQLHKRFIEVVGHLGVKNAVPKTIMNLMNVEGLSRENVASHLQKYRLYLKRMQTGSSSNNNNNNNPQEQQQQQFSASRMANYRGFEGNSYPFNMTMQQRDWSGSGFQHQTK